MLHRFTLPGFLALLLFANSVFAAAGVIAVSGDNTPVNLAANGAYLIDESGQLTINDVHSLSAGLRWQTKGEEVPNFGFSENVVWAKYDLKATNGGISNGIISIGYPLLDDVEVYLYLNGLQIKKYELGDKHPFAKRPVKHRHFLIPVSLFEENEYQLYIRIKTTSSLQFPVILWDQTQFWLEDSKSSMVNVLYLGALGIMVLYNLALFGYLRERAYLYYVALVFGAIGFQTGIDGYAYQMFFPNSPMLQDKVVSISISFQMLMAIQFAKNVLNINPKHKKSHFAINVMLVLAGASIIFSALLPYSVMIQPISVCAAVMCLVWLWAGIYEWRKGNKSAQLFVLAWTSLVVGVVVLSLNKNGVLPRVFVTEYAMVLGTLGQMVLFSLALASRINEERNEREKAANQALEANERALEHMSKYQELYEESLEGMFKCNQKGEFLHANPAMAKMLGFDDVTRLMESRYSFKEDMFADSDQLKLLFSNLRTDGAVRDFDAELLNRNRGYFWGALTIRMVEDSSGHRKNFEGSIRDITERREKEKAEMEKKAAFEATQAKSYFLANMSHEIRTPLTAIIGFAETLQHGGLQRKDEQSYIGTIIRSSQHLLHVINEILDLSKIEANKLDVESVEVDLFAVVQDIQSYSEMKARNKGLNFNIVYEFPLPRYIYSDQTRLRQILLNLTSNALKFTEKGAITITVSHVPEEGNISFKVEDTGIGMSQEQQNKVFDSFTQADVSTTRLHGGTGLGLSIAKKLAEVMGGGISLTSEIDKGSTFEVRVGHGDLADVEWVSDLSQAGLQQEDVNAPIQIPSLTGNILYAEDNLDNQQLISMLVSPTGANLTVVENGAEAMKEALNHQYDLILMDIQMPMMSGTTATKLLRENGYTNPIVAITANLMDYEVKEYLAVGCNGYLAKPVNRVRFYEVLSLYLEANNSSDSADQQVVAQVPGVKYSGRVLIADDVEENRQLFTNKLHSYGLDVVAVSDGNYALEEALSNDYHLVLMDLNMPNMKGEEAVSLLRSSGYIEPIVALTADDDSETIQRLLGNGFDGHLVKPLNEKLLEKVLERYVPLEDSGKGGATKESHTDVDPAFQELIDNYVKGLFDYVKKLNEAHDARDFETLKALAHQLKGSGGSFGFNEISQAAKALETAIKEGRFEAALTLHANLIHVIGEACDQSLNNTLGITG